MRRAILLMGPTGAGKSDLALALAAELPLEIVSVDSAQVYRGMDIGTAKPSAAVRAKTIHHLVDIRDPEQSFSAGEFTREVAAVMQQIWQRNRHPLLVGGTMLYFHALTSGIARLPEADPHIRADIDARAAQYGWQTMHAELAQVDPAAARRIHVNDPQRIQRALEVHRLTGETITEMQQRRVSVFTDVEVTEIAVAPLERSELHTRIETRFDAMLAAGFLAEVGNLFKRSGLTAEHPSMRAVGYRQVWRHLLGLSSMQETRIQAIAATRQLAKRQHTWLRKRTGAQWFDSTRPDTARRMTDALLQGGFATPPAVTSVKTLC